MKKFFPVSDLAIEAAEGLTLKADKSPGGVQVIKEECILPDTCVTWVKITDDEGAKAMGKAYGQLYNHRKPVYENKRQGCPPPPCGAVKKISFKA